MYSTVPRTAVIRHVITSLMYCTVPIAAGKINVMIMYCNYTVLIFLRYNYYNWNCTYNVHENR